VREALWSENVQDGLRARTFHLGGFVDVQVSDDAVLHHHCVALGAHAEAEADELARAITGLRDEARRAGVPPGWLR